MKPTFRSLLIAGLSLVLFQACQPADQGAQPMSAEEVVTTLQKKLIEAQDGDIIMLPEGTFKFKRALSFNDVPNVTIKGAGKGKTILSFLDQIEGAEGLIVKNARNITLEGFTVSDSKGDAIKVQACEDVIMRDLEATWTQGAKSTNGAYGLYPVSSTNVLMEHCEASFAMDAGIYVGQSTNVIVRNNYAHHNVAGIEIENTRNGEVYDNVAKQNTTGMLIFDMPDLPQANGYKIRFYNNLMEDNNGENFAAPGLVVSTLPPGTGMLLMAHTEIEVHDNTIRNHRTQGIAVTSWLFTGESFESEEFDPYCTDINVFNNVIEGTEGPVDTTSEFGKLFHALFDGQAFDIVVDGIFKPSTLDEAGNPTGICFRNNGEVSFVNLNAAKGMSPDELMRNVDQDATKFDCELPSFDLGDYDKWLAANN